MHKKPRANMSVGDCMQIIEANTSDVQSIRDVHLGTFGDA